MFTQTNLNWLQGPVTARETSFVQVFGRELHEAREATRRYRAYGDTAHLDKAWDIYYGVSRTRSPPLCIFLSV